MSKWNTKAEQEWLRRVELEAHTISVKADSGALAGPEIEDAIIALFKQAIKRMPDDAIVNAIERVIQ